MWSKKAQPAGGGKRVRASNEWFADEKHHGIFLSLGAEQGQKEAMRPQMANYRDSVLGLLHSPTGKQSLQMSFKKGWVPYFSKISVQVRKQ